MPPDLLTIDDIQRAVIEERVKLPEVQKEKCSCLRYAKKLADMPINTGVMSASRQPVNSQIPLVGALILTRESSQGHAGVVVSFTLTTVTFRDTNYSRCKQTERTLPLNSPLIRGYYVKTAKTV